MIDQTGDVSSPKSVVDIHHDQSGGAGLKHRRQSRFAGAATAITRRHWKPDHRYVDEARDQAWQHAIHARCNDEDVCAPFECRGERTDEPVQACNAEVGIEPRLQAAGFDGVTMSEHHGGFHGYLPNPLQAAGWCLEAMPHGGVLTLRGLELGGAVLLAI